MKQMGKYATVLVAGFALGAGAIQGLHAQAGKAPAYAIAEVEVADPPLYQAYLAKAIDSLKPYNARIIVRAKPDMKEGTPVQGNVVITSFDSLADAEKWYSTPPYKELIAERQKSSKSRFYIVEGVRSSVRDMAHRVNAVWWRCARPTVPRSPSCRHQRRIAVEP
jgi:uncharacterized protein (DUF1330 family)